MPYQFFIHHFNLYKTLKRSPKLRFSHYHANILCRALFSRGLAELKYMGMIKNNRKKADHLNKLLWKGL